ncbi:MAG TPA: non-ribosomal peptide synthetase [Candidatus Udaeobacter sp.]|nr:non-ribosomal peptide synthetase [Candidatus Udaeobacter sp.]
MRTDHKTIASIASLLRDRALERPDAPALLAPGRPPLTFAGLWEQSRDLAGRLESLGASHSTRVAIVIPNGPAAAAAFLGVAACAPCVPLNPAARTPEFRFYLEDTRAQVLIVLKGDRGPARSVADELGVKVVEIEVHAADEAGRVRLSPGVAERGRMPGFSAPDDIALVLYTSGTTAGPKMVPLTHANLTASAGNIARHLALSPADRCLNVMPLFHIHGLVGALLASLTGGGSVVCTPGFSPEHVFDWLEESEATWYTAVPTMHQEVLARVAANREAIGRCRLRFIRSSSAALAPEVMSGVERAFNVPVIEAFGMTEASHQIASNPLPPGRRVPGSVGVAAGAEIAIMDPSGRPLAAGETGEIVVRGRGVTGGYEGNADANATAFRDGWFRTGDLGRLDHDGYLFITSRLKEIVNRGGEKISPREIDEALLEHPSVAQAAAFAVPHPSLGEDLVVAVVLRPGSRADQSELREFLFSRLSDFKVPSQIVFVETLPTGNTGKVQRTTLHEKLGALLHRPFVAPEKEIERSVEAIFREVLECGSLSIHDNFFALGGDSLKGIRVIARINADHGLQLPAVSLFRHPSIAEMAMSIERSAALHREEEAALSAEIQGLSDEEVERVLRESNEQPRR